MASGADTRKGEGVVTHPRGEHGGVRLCAKWAMASYWRCGQAGFLDSRVDAKALDFAVPLGFESLIAPRGGGALRDEVLGMCRPDLAFDPVWLCHADGEDVASRALVCRLLDPDWVLVVFRGTTPSPLRGLLREGPINGRAGQVSWSLGHGKGVERVHSGYAATWDRMEGLVTRAVERALKASGPRTNLVVVGHSLGGAVATLAAVRLSSETGVPVELVTFGQPRVGDPGFAEALDGSDDLGGYLRVVLGGDLFARVPTSGIWLPAANEGRFKLEYAHAGDLLWLDPLAHKDELGGEDQEHQGKHGLFVPKSHAVPGRFWTDPRQLNPVQVVRGHATYAYALDSKDVWPPNVMPGDADTHG